MTGEASFTSLYPELRALAHARLRAARDTLLDTTSLVHEFYLRLAESGNVSAPDWPHFLQYASRAMRNIIVDSIRRRCAERHGGGVVRIDLSGEPSDTVQHGEAEILTLHTALDELEKMDPRMASLVEMRYFGGMTEPEIAIALGITERTVRREWRKARLILAQALG